MAGGPVVAVGVTVAVLLAGCGSGPSPSPVDFPQYQVVSIEKMASYISMAAAAPFNTDNTTDPTDEPVLREPLAITYLNDTGVDMKATVTGLVPGMSYMFHIHIGTDCAIAATDYTESQATQGKCWAGPEGCQWLQPTKQNSQTMADADGKATWDYTSNPAPANGEGIVGRAVVFHRIYGDVDVDTYDEANSPRMACGLVADKTLSYITEAAAAPGGSDGIWPLVGVAIGLLTLVASGAVLYAHRSRTNPHEQMAEMEETPQALEETPQAMEETRQV